MLIGLCKDQLTQNVMHLLIFISSILASSLAVSPEDKRWLLDTLLSLHQEAHPGVVPTYTPEWEVPGPAPLPTPVQWMSDSNYGFPVSPLVRPSVHPLTNKRNYEHMSSFGLLCCNHPPTRPPRMKRPTYNRGRDNRWRNLVLDVIKKSLNNRSDRFESLAPRQTMAKRLLRYMDSDNEPIQRRGVTVVKGGVSGINTG